METLEQAQRKLVDDINATGDILFQYTYLIERAKELPSFDERKQAAARKVAGCQSNVWVITRVEDGAARIEADSDTLIVRGLLALIIELFDGRSVDEIMEARVNVLTETELSEAFSEERMAGFGAIIKTIRQALAGTGAQRKGERA